MNDVTSFFTRFDTCSKVDMILEQNKFKITRYEFFELVKNMKD